jgi:hypothetical protein
MLRLCFVTLVWITAFSYDLAKEDLDLESDFCVIYMAKRYPRRIRVITSESKEGKVICFTERSENCGGIIVNHLGIEHRMR